ncbi:MBL fold metallo-hydrolase [Desulforamulus aeronauticus]|uniref:L-ascorbate metabolism protein UlaG, beta-lactamase superfamily n=1 Tax=Desulforamulus aeronauticus DSM 10349 TaxID=1121421 RepID=A0A1M6PN98_9FIRM|nr:MBL fold metallo-hydrolase [Desulforamulus aeronauticus]SHK09397.1 L-ascorbate metabolism protein UlaG, beta-lactamase superfamily [Desulforamulus aeronauticus DSM 10349]
MKGRFGKVLLVSLIIIVVIALSIGLYLQHPKFGTLPAGARLERIKNSPHYAGGQFQNLLPTPEIIGDNLFSTLWNFLFVKKERLVPVDDIPSIKTDIMALDKDEDVVIWLGHSSYFVQLGGKRILIDPVFSPSAAPVSFANKAFKGTNPYTADDIPIIDYLLISHDHWDHLDYPTVISLKPKIRNVICGLGVGSYFEEWGFAANIVHEADWFTAVKLENDFTVHVLPARHFSGRMLTRNKTLWTSLALVTPEHRIFFSGDGGYGPHFKQIGETFQGFDLAIMENGQYDKNWPYIHMMSEEAAQATEDLKAKALLPGHAGKFTIANHPWDEPFQRINAASQNKDYRLLTPMIGELVELANEQQVFAPWWEGMN